MRLNLFLATAGAALSLSAVPLAAQFGCTVDAPAGGVCTSDHTVSASVNTVAILTLSTGQTSFTVAAADFGTPKITAGPTISVNSNAAWRLEVNSTASVWTGGDNNKPSSQLQFGLGTDTPRPVSMSPTPIASGSAGTQLATTSTTLRSDWILATDPPGDYALTLVFTVTAP